MMNHHLLVVLKDLVLNRLDGSSGIWTIMITWISSHTPYDYYFRKKICLELKMWQFLATEDCFFLSGTAFWGTEDSRITQQHWSIQHCLEPPQEPRDCLKAWRIREEMSALPPKRRAQQTLSLSANKWNTVVSTAIFKLGRHTHKLLTSLQRKKAHTRKGSYALHVLLKMQLYLTLYQTVLSYETKMDQHICCQHAGSVSNHTELSQGTRPRGQMGSDAAQISWFLWEGEAELAPCSPPSCPWHRTALGSDELSHPSLPSCHTAILALSPRAPLLLPLFFLLIQTHHQSPLPIPKLLMPESP